MLKQKAELLAKDDKILLVTIDKVEEVIRILKVKWLDIIVMEELKWVMHTNL